MISGEVKKVETALAALGNTSQSSQRGKVLIISTTDASETDVNKEYVVLKAPASNRGPIPLTGWRLESSLTAKSASIGGGVETLVLGKGGGGTIVLNPGDTVIVSSGHSPVGTSFRVNACSGYLSQFQTFTPDLSLFCPFPKNETTFSSSQDLGEACYDALDTIPRCRI
ncbi:MAG: hypothetical protein Q7S07_02795, partial [Candidatus Omnitrophota bacterium]|nr:hypothetical protein [Candidatus Omnitrophota bacterium]